MARPVIKIEKTEVCGWEAAIRGMRNPMNSWDKSDSFWCNGEDCPMVENGEYPALDCNNGTYPYCLGENDYDLMKRLVKSGSDHSKFMRMLLVTVDVTAPFYWWKEYDTYKVGTVANSCSTMHKITSKPIELSDFSMDDFYIEDCGIDLKDMFIGVVADCEHLRKKYLKTKDKRYWRGLIQLLPESYNQKRTLLLNYAVLRNIYHSRKNHKLSEWHTFCEWVETLPYSELITM